MGYTHSHTHTHTHTHTYIHTLTRKLHSRSGRLAGLWRWDGRTTNGLFVLWMMEQSSYTAFWEDLYNLLLWAQSARMSACCFVAFGAYLYVYSVVARLVQSFTIGPECKDERELFCAFGAYL